jgi:hypothetical protein
MPVNPGSSLESTRKCTGFFTILLKSGRAMRGWKGMKRTIKAALDFHNA